MQLVLPLQDKVPLTLLAMEHPEPEAGMACPEKMPVMTVVLMNVVVMLGTCGDSGTPPPRV